MNLYNKSNLDISKFKIIQKLKKYIKEKEIKKLKK